VSKSIPSILGIGAAGLILMCLMMKHLAEVKSGRDRSPYSAAVEARLGSKLDGKVRIDDVDEDGRLVRVVQARLLAGLKMKKAADAIGLEVWLGSMRAGDLPDQVRVVITDDDREQPRTETFLVAAPTTRR